MREIERDREREREREKERDKESKGGVISDEQVIEICLVQSL